MRRSLVILTAFCLFFVLWYFDLTTRSLVTLIGESKSLHYSLNYLLAGLVLVAALFLLHPRREILPSMGLSGGFGIRELTFDKGLTRIVIAGVFEELIFVFGQLFRYARWVFLPAALLTTLVFGSLQRERLRRSRGRMGKSIARHNHHTGDRADDSLQKAQGTTLSNQD